MPSSGTLRRSPSYLLYAAFLFAAPVPSIAQDPPASEKTFCSKAGNYFQAGGNSVPYEIVDGMAVVEEDIIVGRGGDSANYGAVVFKRKTWDGGVFPYRFAEGFPEEMKKTVKGAIRDLNDQTNYIFTFTEITDIASNQRYTDYVTFNFAEHVCNSWVGKTGGEQLINLSEGCKEPEILHEIGHALGLYHEHNRPDRDAYVRINWKNIDLSKQGARIAFCRIRRDEGEKKGAYDFASIMHYSSRDFGRKDPRDPNKKLTTIDALEAGKKVPDKHNQVLSPGDKKTLADLYGFPPPPGTPPRPNQKQEGCKVSSTKQRLVKHPVFVYGYQSNEIKFALAADSRVWNLGDELDDRRRTWYKIKVDKYLRTSVDGSGRLVRNKDDDVVPIEIEAAGWILSSHYNEVVSCP
jgi:hypothetical protein